MYFSNIYAHHTDACRNRESNQNLVITLCVVTFGQAFNKTTIVKMVIIYLSIK